MTDPDGWKTNKLAEEQTLWKGRARGARGRPSTAQLGLVEFPTEAKLAVDQNDDSEDARALRRKRRVAKPIQAFDFPTLYLLLYTYYFILTTPRRQAHPGVRP